MSEDNTTPQGEAGGAPGRDVPGDDFRGNNERLIDCIHALGDMSDEGALVPHGLGGHARKLLLAAANRLPTPAVAEEDQESRGEVLGSGRAQKARPSRALTGDSLSDWRPTHRHVKRGTEYRVIGRGWVQCSDSIVADDEEVVVYQAENGGFWVRPPGEFYDGRFEPISPPSSGTPTPPSDGEGEAQAKPTAPNSSPDSEQMIAELSSLAARWVALDGGSWNVERHAREKDELLADTRAALTKARAGGEA